MVKLSINGNPVKVLSITKRGAEVQNLLTKESDEDFYVVFCYAKPNCSLSAYPTDIQKDKVELTLDLKGQLKDQGFELAGDVVFKELRALFLNRVSTESYDYLFVNEEFSLYRSTEWEFIDAVKPLMYNHNELLNHLWRKVNAFYHNCSKNPQAVFRYIYYARLYQQTFNSGKYNPWLANEEWASEIRDVKLGGSSRYSLEDYKFEVEKLHLMVKSTSDTTIQKFKSKILEIVQRNASYILANLWAEEIKLPIESSLLSECYYSFNMHDKDRRDPVIVIFFSTHPEDTYEFENFTFEDLKDALEAKSFGRYFKTEIENKFTVYKNGKLLTERS